MYRKMEKLIDYLYLLPLLTWLCANVDLSRFYGRCCLVSTPGGDAVELHTYIS